MEYEKLSDKVLIKILEEIQNIVDEEDLDFTHEPFSSENQEAIDEACKYFGINIENYTDRSFFIQLYLDNPFYFKTGKPLNRPTLGVYEVTTNEYGRSYTTTTFVSKIYSYKPILVGDISDLEYNDDHLYYDGDKVNEYVDDHEIFESEIKSITKINNKKL